MIIDFHTHVFPDKISKLAIEKLKGHLKLQGEECAAYTDGTVSSLLESMEKSNTDMSVSCPLLQSRGNLKASTVFLPLLTEKTA